MEMPRIILLQIFAAWPAPAPPQCTIFLPIFSSTGFAAANALSSPPHMKVSVAALAPPVPPETGASTDSTPCFSASVCAWRALSTSMVELSMISAPLAMAGTTSFQTDSTCLPAGSMVTTTSAPFTAPVALSAIDAPSALAWSREASTRSNAMTLWPALTRLAAIGPPMLPRPMNAIVAISLSSAFSVSLSVEFQFVSADLGEIRRNHSWRDVLDPRRRPFRIAVLVDDRGADALAEIVAAEDFERGAVFSHQAILQRPCLTRQPQQLERHHHASRRFLAQRLQGRLRELGAVVLERGDDILHAVESEQRVDLRLH